MGCKCFKQFNTVFKGGVTKKLHCSIFTVFLYVQKQKVTNIRHKSKFKYFVEIVLHHTETYRTVLLLGYKLDQYIFFKRL